MGEMESEGAGTDRVAKGRRALLSAFQTAVRRRLVEENPVTFTDPPDAFEKGGKNDFGRKRYA
jgi:hypothetical protein